MQGQTESRRSTSRAHSSDAAPRCCGPPHPIPTAAPARTYEHARARDLTVACMPREFFVPVVRQEFNYPPCLTVVHFDPVNDAIPVLARDTVLRMRLLWYAMMGILFFNGPSAPLAC